MMMVPQGRPMQGRHVSVIILIDQVFALLEHFLSLVIKALFDRFYELDRLLLPLIGFWWKNSRVGLKLSDRKFHLLHLVQGIHQGLLLGQFLLLFLLLLLVLHVLQHLGNVDNVLLLNLWFLHREQLLGHASVDFIKKLMVR